MKAKLILLLLLVYTIGGSESMEETKYGIVEGVREKTRILGPGSSSSSSSDTATATAATADETSTEGSVYNGYAGANSRYYLVGAMVLSMAVFLCLAFFVRQVVERRKKHKKSSQNAVISASYHLQREGNNGDSAVQTSCKISPLKDPPILGLFGKENCLGNTSTNTLLAEGAQPLARKPLSRLFGIIDKSKKSKQINMCYHIQHFETPPSTDSEGKEYVPCVISDISTDDDSASWSRDGLDSTSPA